MRHLILFIILVAGILSKGCKENKKDQTDNIMSSIEAPDGMVWIPGGKFEQGAVEFDKMAMNHEKPTHIVELDGFYIDATEVTNAKFKKFVEETGYVTIAEREVDWEEIKNKFLLEPQSLMILSYSLDPWFLKKLK